MAQRQLEEHHSLGHVAAQEKMRHLHTAGTTVRNENRIKGNTLRNRARVGRTLRKHRGRAVTVLLHIHNSKKKRTATINIFMTRSKIKRLVHELMRQKGAREIVLWKTFGGRKLRPFLSLDNLHPSRCIDRHA